mmetsp:Transcript_18913/g.75425  ORF Transcript_18913/g.75425 Transcript_18913/m.75425 type:complete len:204 (+) Transcript_18913:377-988(+)
MHDRQGPRARHRAHRSRQQRRGRRRRHRVGPRPRLARGVVAAAARRRHLQGRHRRRRGQDIRRPRRRPRRGRSRRQADGEAAHPEIQGARVDPVRQRRRTRQGRRDLLWRRELAPRAHRARRQGQRLLPRQELRRRRAVPDVRRRGPGRRQRADAAQGSREDHLQKRPDVAPLVSDECARPPGLRPLQRRPRRPDLPPPAEQR